MSGRLLANSVRFITTKRPCTASCPRRRFSSKNADACSPSTSIANQATASELTAKSDASTSNFIARHGPGDGIIKLNVGGKEFVTLRSTICSNRVLAEYVARAEANGEWTDGKTAVFIDRDPTHFGIMLTFLRNRVEGIAYNTKFTQRGMKKLNAYPKYVRLPRDRDVLQDLYVEATHYEIRSLQRQLCQSSIMTIVLSQFGAGGNPFDQASSFFKHFKRFSAITLVGTGGTIMATLQQDLDWLTGGRLNIKLPGVSDDEKKSETAEEEKAGEASLA